MTDSCMSCGGLVEIAESADMRNESAIARNECTIYVNESATASNESTPSVNKSAPPKNESVTKCTGEFIFWVPDSFF